MRGTCITFMDNLMFAARDGCLQPVVRQSCSSPSVSVAAEARTSLVLHPVDGCSRMGLADECMWAAQYGSGIP